MTIIINPKYENLREFLLHLHENFNKEGTEIFKGRNTIKLFNCEGMTLYVKSYGKLSWKNRLCQRILHKTPKGIKAYLRPLQLRERGFESPDPIGYVSVRKNFKRCFSYFVCLASEYTHSMGEYSKFSKEEQIELIDCFARYAARLHEDGFLHRDFSSDNILFDKVNGKYRFSLVDTNSIKCGAKIGIEKGCKSLADLDGDDFFFKELATKYAEERKTDPNYCFSLVQKYKQ